nr:hypothetical protein [Ardenticatena sp.]
MKQYWRLSGFFVVFVLLVACQAQTAPQVPETESGQNSQNEHTFVVPTPTDDAGVVVGQLLTPGPGGRPYIATLYLATFVHPQGNADAPPLISFSEETSLKGVQDPTTGRFYFENVPPGKYAIIIWTPVVSMPLRDADSNTEITFEVKAGEVTDLGVIAIP